MFRRVGSRMCGAVNATGFPARNPQDPFRSRLALAAEEAISTHSKSNKVNNLSNLSDVAAAACATTTRSANSDDDRRSPAEVLREFLLSQEATHPKAYNAPEADADAMTTFRDSRNKTGLGGTKVTADMPLSEAASVLDATAADKWRRQLIFQSQWRGMSELDLILGAFAKRLLQTPYEASGVVEIVTEALVQDLRDYDEILREFDNDLNKWLIEDKEAPSRVTDNRLWASLAEFVAKNKDLIVKYR